MDPQKKAIFDESDQRFEELRQLDGGAEVIDFVKKAARGAGEAILAFGQHVGPKVLEGGADLLVSIAMSEIEDALKKR